jgi:hypothetical protein
MAFRVVVSVLVRSPYIQQAVIIYADLRAPRPDEQDGRPDERC